MNFLTISFFVFHKNTTEITKEQMQKGVRVCVSLKVLKFSL
jgi:hypothetical protein